MEQEATAFRNCPTVIQTKQPAPHKQRDKENLSLSLKHYINFFYVLMI